MHRPSRPDIYETTDYKDNVHTQIAECSKLYNEKKAIGRWAIDKTWYASASVGAKYLTFE
jgi:hypothetical protein